MTELFEMLNAAIARRKNASPASPFASSKAAEKWLKTLPAESDYDTHHALVEGLERFTAENAAATPGRLKALRTLEEAGLPLQARIVEQYVRNQAAFRLARQALWRESWAFWSLLADAWLALLRPAVRGETAAELKPFAAEIAARALHYSSLAMRWDYHQARNPAASAWRRMHKIYRLAERDGLAMREVTINARATHCAREYTLAVLMGLVQPLGYRAREIESIAQIFEGYAPLPLPETEPQPDRHSHMVDMSLGEGGCVLDTEWLRGRRLRYFSMRPLVEHLKALDPAADAGNALTRQMASLIERGGVRRIRRRTHRFGQVWAATGMAAILPALAGADAGHPRPPLEAWNLRDESPEGMGFELPQAAALPHGRLAAVSWNPAESAWHLLAIRWVRQEDGRHLVGTQCLSRAPKRVEVTFDPDDAGAARDSAWALFLPRCQPEQAVSSLLVPATHYRPGGRLRLRDGDALYRLRLGEVQESHEGWLRVDLEVIGREQFAAAA